MLRVIKLRDFRAQYISTLKKFLPGSPVEGKVGYSPLVGSRKKWKKEKSSYVGISQGAENGDRVQVRGGG